MKRSGNTELIDWLMTGGPILRYLTARDLCPATSRTELGSLLEAARETEETRKWLDLLGTGPIRHSKDSAFENCMGKLLEYGLHAGVPELDRKVKPFLELDPEQPNILVVAFVSRAGYDRHPAVQACLRRMIQNSSRAARRGRFDVAMTDSEKNELLPASLRGKPFFRLECSPLYGEYRPPSCYELYAFGHMRRSPAQTRKLETIVAYLIDPRLQEQDISYIWNPELRRQYSCSYARLPGFKGRPPARGDSSRLIMYLEMLVGFKCVCSSEWLQDAMAKLETFRTDRGTYQFPKEYLLERKDSYYLYQGSHMGLGGEPRNKRALEMESTFRMLRLRNRMCQHGPWIERAADLVLDSAADMFAGNGKNCLRVRKWSIPHATQQPPERSR